MSKKRYIAPVFVPHLGCPNDCIFCNQKKITNHKQAVDKKDVIESIESYRRYFPDQGVEREIAFFGGSFTAIDFDAMVEYLKIAKDYKDKGLIEYIRLSTRPDAIDLKILDTLKYYGVDIIELGVQSMNDLVLEANNRGHNSKSVYEASKLIKSYGFTLGHQIMPGLYKDSYDLIMDTAKQVIAIGPDIVRIYPTLVITNTRLEALYKAGIYQPLALDEAVEISKELLLLFNQAKIQVIRIGLQPTDNITLGKDVVAGPFHPSMRSLVEESIYYDILDQAFKDYKILDRDEIEIHVSNSKLSYVVGNKAINKEKLRKKYRIKNIKYRGLETESFYIVLEDKKIELGVV